jgi:hypothetical protein
MRKKRFSEGQAIWILRQAERGEQTIDEIHLAPSLVGKVLSNCAIRPPRADFFPTIWNWGD